MPARQFTLFRSLSTTDRLSVEWEADWSDVSIFHNGHLIGNVAGRDTLYRGYDLSLPDKSTVSLYLQSGVSGKPQLHIFHNNRPLYDPDQEASDRNQWRAAFISIYIVSAMSIFAGIGSVIFQVEELVEMGIDWFALTAGLVFVGVGYLVQRKSLSALYIAITLYGLEALLGICLVLGGAFSVTSLFMRGLFLFFMIRGVPALQRVREASYSYI